MVHIFRKEIKKVKYLLWIVFLGFAIPSFLRRSGVKPRHESIIARVNGQPITMAEFQRTQNEIQQQYYLLSMYFGIPFKQKISDSEVLRRCASDKLVDGIIHSTNLQLDNDFVQEELARKLAPFVDETGKINMEAYGQYVKKMNMKIAEFEQSQEEQIKRNVFADFVRNAYYTPSYVAQGIFEQQASKKQFAVLKFPLEKFVASVKAELLTDEAKRRFYAIHQEEYRIPERRKAHYVVLDPAHVAATLTVDDETVENYYNRNKEQFKTPARIKIRRLVFKKGSTQLDAQAAYTELKEKPSHFADYVKKHSADKDAVAKGGLTDYIERGALEPALEQAAFRLREKGEITPVLQTRNGLELIQLEDRIAPVEKTLSSVKHEIVKTLTNRKAAQQLKASVEALARQARQEDTTALFDQFVETNHGKAVESGWLSAQDASAGNQLLNELAAKIFGKNEKLGWLVSKNQYVVYLATESEKSYVPAYEKVADRIAQDLQADKGRQAMHEAVNKVRKEALDHATSLEAAAKDLGLSIVTTALAKAKDEIPAFKGTGSLVNQAFELNDPVEVLKFKHKDACFLVQLTKQEPAAASEELQKEKIIESEREYGRNGYFDSFIASLLRSAKIENEKNVDLNSTNE